MYKTLLEEVRLIWQDIKQYAWTCPDVGSTKPRLTEHDISTERKLCEIISKIDPLATFFAEEEHDTENIDQTNLRVIDPISNTFNFIHWLPHYSICISHVIHWVANFAIIYDPSMDELFYAIKWEWAYLNDKKIVVTKNTSDLAILIGPNLVPNNLSRNQKVIDLISKVQSLWTIRILWSFGLQYAYVACWKADCTIWFPKDIFPEMAWKLLVEEAWWIFTTHTWEEINFNTRDVIACNQSVYQNILQAIQ
jgi:myo-inositol-1(or 4)-monophosphatase